MSLTPGTRLGPYEVTALLGEGGMGQVYRARDTRLGRDVAIKVLPEALAADPERIARFEREAKALAALHHPHIASIFGVEDASGIRALVMELVEGEDLSARIARGPIPLDEALPIALQIAEALEAAHERGIVHRDLKPANIKVSGDPLTVKVLDFGLAKALDPATGSRPPSHGFGGTGPGDDRTNSPTLSIMATGVGVILGTAAYMSPEQAKGQATDHRSDIFSFGCVLFEMIAGRRTFEGENVSEILASVIKSEPDWAALPSDLHPRLIELLKRCLAKSRRDRYQAVGDVRFELTTIHRNPVAPAITATPAKRARWSWAIGLAAAALAGAAVASAIFLTRAAESSSAPIRFVVPLREGAVFTGPGRRTVGISPDGTAIVYAADQRLHVRRLGDLESRAITDKYEPNSPTYSPDGQWIAFYDNFSEEVKRVAAAGGVATTVAKIGRVPYDLAWSSNGLFYTSDPGVLRLREGNAQPELVAKADAGETFGSIDMIPGGPLLVSSVDQISRGDNPTTGFDRARVLAILPDGQRRVLWEGGTSARYLASGHLAFVRQGVLFAVGFDAKRLTMVGAPVPVVEGVGRAQAVGQFSVSSSGALVYIPGPSAGASGPWQLAIFSSTQPEGAPLKVPPASYVQARVSPNGKTVALSMDNDKESAIWLHDLVAAGSLRRLTLGAAARFPAWSADGQRIAYQRQSDKGSGVFWQRADGSDTPEAITQPGPGTSHIPTSWSPNGERLLFDEVNEKGVTVWVYSVRDRKATLVPGFESIIPTWSAFSADGRWITAAIRRSGTRSIVLVQPFPPTGAVYQISKEGTEDGHHSVWARDGTTLIYNPGPGNDFKVVPVKTTPTFSFSEPRDLIAHFRREAPSAPRSFDLLPDGRFIAFSGPAGNDVGASHMVVVLNWLEELKQRVPVAR